MEQIQVEYLYKLKKLRGNMTNYKDVLAKLLSTEDVQVVRAEVPTASFDVKNRVLTLPTFVNLSENIENLMIGHEVGHALWTPEKGVTKEMAQDKLLKQYANVIEDVRIEKMIQAEYPGLRQDFIKGYKKLAEDDFFGVGKKDINSLNLIDKINLYFKIGLKSGIKFSKEEFEIVSRVDSCKTFKEVIALAKELSNYARKKKKEEEEKMLQQNMDILEALDQEEQDFDEQEQEESEEEFEESEDYGDSGDDDSEEGEEESDEQEESGGSHATRAGEHQADETPGTVHEYDEELAPQTQDALDEMMKKHAKFDNKIFRNVEMKEFPLGIDPIIGYKEIIKDLESSEEDRQGYKRDSAVHKMMNDDQYISESGHWIWVDREPHDGMIPFYGEDRKWIGSKSGPYYKEDYANFMNSIKKDIDFMVKEFEMKKSAQRYARTEIAKTGQLNINKLYNYKLSEDLFKRVQVCADDKNHGFIMLVDWSGSMHHCMRDTMRQVITLATFCRKVNIPFQVLAFSNHDNLWNQGKEESDPRWMKVAQEKAEDHQKLHYIKRSTMWLYELLSHEMSQKDFDKMSFYMHSFMWHYSYDYSLSGTPLTEALECSVGIVGRFIKKHNIDKMNFITLTDGAGWAGGIQNNYDLFKKTYGDDLPFRIESTDTIIDPVTKKKYVVGGSQGDNSFDFAYLDMISSRYNCATIGYYIGRNSQQGMQQFAHYNIQNPEWRHNYDAVNEVRVECRKNGGWVSIKDCGRDEMFFLDERKLNPKSKEVEVDGQKSSAQIARAFSKGLKQNRQSKVLMSTFVERVA